MTEPKTGVGANSESSPLNQRLPHALRERLTALSARVPIVCQHKLALAALDARLAALEADPTALLRDGTAETAAPTTDARRRPTRAMERPARRR